VKLRIAINGTNYDVEVEDAAEPASLEHSVASLPPVQSTVLPTAAGGASSDFDEAKVVRSPLAGVVSRIHVQPGQQVKATQVLAVLEAMKMEIKIPAHADGTVKTVEAAPGDAVRPNQILVCLE
jgi:biotin carboxyl carrier protein